MKSEGTAGGLMMQRSGPAEPGRRVVINGRFLGQPLSGVQRFAWEMVRAMDALRAVDRGRGIPLMPMEICCPAATPEPPAFATLPLRRCGRLRGYLWDQIDLPLAARGALVLNLANMGPVLSRKVTTLHDAIVWEMPGNYSWRFAAAYRLLLPLIARTSRHCVTVSQHARQALAERGIAGGRPISVIYNGADHIRRADPAAEEEAGEEGSGEGVAWPERFVFALGNAAPNKNLALVRQLAPRLRRQGIMTVVAGGRPDAIFAAVAPEEAGILALGRVPDAVIREGYRRALAFLFPSFHEGFGIPPVEAMALGCPVIASASSAMPEVLGDAALLRDPHRPDPWFEAVMRIAGDPGLRAALIRKGLERAGMFRWEDSARRMLALLADAA